ncbi:hypothetical protein [Thauera sp. SDU_THAU2]|uniref:hypothetical protein n=1 Tax=Thauera sp. SDU_THAU2 TaxID=3136633 RepID=UPI00311DBDBC
MQKPQPKAATLDASMLELRMQARSEEARARYGDCWLLMDREDAADDNAEHLIAISCNRGGPIGHSMC